LGSRHKIIPRELLALLFSKSEIVFSGSMKQVMRFDELR